MNFSNINTKAFVNFATIVSSILVRQKHELLFGHLGGFFQRT